MRALRHLFRGLAEARRRPGLVALAYLAPLLPALVLASVAGGFLRPSLERSRFAERVMDGRWTGVWTDFAATEGRGLSEGLGSALPGLLAASLAVQVLLAVVIVGRLVAGRRATGTLPWGGLRRYGWTFARSALWFLAASALVALAAALAFALFRRLAIAQGDGRFDLVGGLAAAGIALVLFAPLDLAYDLSRIAAVRHDDRSTFKGLLRALGLVMRNPGLFAPLYLSFLALPGSLHLVYFAIRSGWTPGTATAVLLLFALQQAVMALRAALKIAFWGAEAECYESLGAPRLSRSRRRSRNEPMGISNRALS